ncbi:multidrug efflux MFS transporter [Anaerocolumna xylanovorans]|uniref:Predicted arabinose efflux permease, MFS family n=1 Tax=Anaerocolumna xylanovorans DSM 12503 TaxID=1121345 RepID=A0A1M7Y783_9FIRM|nr:multidrug efflux MFS transporter [Anaerocolumna xylanovorans]SHO48386.1 Predicted arabinose efflux permease, MFS family [Anaerocolumna xylanovorans DSM 12503]
MPLWKRNLLVCWFGMFVTGIGMSQIAPVLPLFIRQLGISSSGEINKISGLAFGITYIVSAIFSPVWGYAADKVGRKPMLLRASLGMGVIVFCMGFAPNVYVLIVLRLLQGAITGYSTACTTLIATQTDKEHAGYALGTLSTANVAGSLLGPTIGGFIEDRIGLQPVFFITGALMFVAFLTTLLFVKENFIKEEKKQLRFREIWNSVPEKQLTVVLSVTLFIITFGLYSIEPIVTVYVGKLSSETSHVALIAGLVFSASGLANVISAPRLGRLSDRIGVHKVILFALIAAGVIYIPQAFVTNPWQLMGLRFLLGLTLGGLNPSVNTLIKKITPGHLTGRIFGITISAGYLGVFLGAVMGGQISAAFGIRHVFYITSALLLFNAVWVYFNVYKKLEKQKQ